ncbi:MAG: hypothetical protein AAF202_12670, partial [Pseudomonadota bacterium]
DNPHDLRSDEILGEWLESAVLTLPVHGHLAGLSDAVKDKVELADTQELQRFTFLRAKVLCQYSLQRGRLAECLDAMAELKSRPLNEEFRARTDLLGIEACLHSKDPKPCLLKANKLVGRFEELPSLRLKAELRSLASIAAFRSDKKEELDRHVSALERLLPYLGPRLQIQFHLQLLSLSLSHGDLETARLTIATVDQALQTAYVGLNLSQLQLEFYKLLTERLKKPDTDLSQQIGKLKGKISLLSPSNPLAKMTMALSRDSKKSASSLLQLQEEHGQFHPETLLFLRALSGLLRD